MAKLLAIMPARRLVDLVAAALLVACHACTPVPPRVEQADLVLRGGVVITVDERLGEAQALAARGGRIVAVGTNHEIAAHVGPDTRVLELAGRTAIPGFIEGHGHFTGIGEAMQVLDLMHVSNWDDVVAMVANAVQDAQPGEWILGRGWHQEKWNRRPEGDVEGFPLHHSISSVSPDNPVSLTHASGHAAFFNARAMELAGVDENTPDPPGGEILRDHRGLPIGVFRETATGLVSRARRSGQVRRTPAERDEALRRAIRLADRECLSKGVTSFQDAGSSFRTIDALIEMAEAGELDTRVWVMIRTGNGQLARRLPDYKKLGVGDHHVTVRAIKRTIDGALGSRGAWLLAPYSDSPGSTGLNTATIESVTETARLAVEHGFQLCVHAIGDRANREVLDLFEQAHPTRTDLAAARWRVEHAQHLSAADIPRFAELGVIASMQGVHCTSDAPYVVPRLGAARAEEGAYVWRKLIDSGALVINGTDAPVEDVDPIMSYHASVTRRTVDGSTFYPGQRMTRMEALQSYTIWAARAAFEEDIKGSLTPGKLADVVVLSHNLLTVADDEIEDAEVLYTIVGGEVVYENVAGSGR